MLRVIVEGIRMPVKRFAGVCGLKHIGLIPGIVAGGFSIRARLLLLAGVMGLAGYQTAPPSSQLSASSAVAWPGLRCAQGADASDESIASALGMDAARLDRLRKISFLVQQRYLRDAGQESSTGHKSTDLTLPAR